MSCYEWEEGTIKLPTKVFAKFRREFIEGYNRIQLTKLDTLKAWREIALRAGKGKRNYDFKDRMLCMASDWNDEQLIEMLFDDNRKPKMPTRKMFDFVNGKVFSFDIGEAGIGFNQTDKTVTWSVFENNHAVESARGTKEAGLLFGMLARVDFTRGSGGTIVGNNEYHREESGIGGGGNYEVATYGKGQRRQY